MTLTARDIAEITRLLEDSSFDELELEVDGLKIHLRRGNGATPHSPAKAAAPPPAAIGSAAIPAKAAGAPLEPGVEPVRAPLLGTFYRAPKPGAPPFVDAGARVEPDTIIGIIEVMKLMNTVRAGVRGTVCDIRARDGTLVEYGETLMTVDTRSAR
jgi:acetyl-CoA carboxylase biotin carboxyl carrier protein